MHKSNQSTKTAAQNIGPNTIIRKRRLKLLYCLLKRKFVTIDDFLWVEEEELKRDLLALTKAGVLSETTGNKLYAKKKWQLTSKGKQAYKEARKKQGST